MDSAACQDNYRTRDLYGQIHGRWFPHFYITTCWVFVILAQHVLTTGMTGFVIYYKHFRLRMLVGTELRMGMMPGLHT